MMRTRPAVQKPSRHPELVSGSISSQAKVTQKQDWMPKQVQHNVQGEGAISVHVRGETLPDRIKSKPDCQIMPVRVLALDKVDLPLPVPTLELFLSQDGVFHITENLISDEAVDAITFGETLDLTVAMLPEPRDQVARNADVQRPVTFTGKYVDAGSSLDCHHAEPDGKWTLKQVQGDVLRLH